MADTKLYIVVKKTSKGNWSKTYWTDHEALTPKAVPWLEAVAACNKVRKEYPREVYEVR